MKAVSWLGSFATILGVSISNLIYFWAKSSLGMRLFLILVLIAAVILAVVDIRSWWGNRAKRFKDEQAVNKYLLHLFKRGGSAAIFAHNLSWVRKAPEIREFLRSEALGGRDIRIFVPQHNDLTKELAAEGIKIKTYSSLSYEPGARFTLLNPKESGSSLLAIGRGTPPNFYIEEFSDQSHSRVIAVVRDLLNILEKVSDRAGA